MSEIKYLSNYQSGNLTSNKHLRNIRTAILAAIIFIPVVIINFFQMASMIFLPISPRVFRSINRFFANYYWGYLVLMLKTSGKLNIKYLGDEIPKEENAMLDCNHQNIADIPLLMPIAWDKNRLGDLKFFVKDVVKFIPGPGWGMLFLDCIFVKRNWQSDKDNIDKIFSKFKKHDIPIWVVSFLEGTRITPSKLKKSQEFMKKRGLPLTSHVMAPRTKGFVASTMGLRSQLDAIYNMTLFYPDGIPTLWQLIAGEVNDVVMYIKRTPIDQIPEQEDEIEKWIIDRYVEKDQFLAAARQHQAKGGKIEWTNETLNELNLPFAKA